MSLRKDYETIYRRIFTSVMLRSLHNQKFLKIVVGIVFTLIPLLSAILFCFKDGKLINDIYIPLGGWSDEITYYKQIEGILAYGMPRGYFGYNQSRALYGSLGVWGLLPLIPYVIFGFFFGWNYCSPIYANILFSMLAFLVIYIFLRPNTRSLGAISIFWITNQFLNRYVLSGVVEASVILQLIIITSCGEYLLSEKIRTQSGRSFTPHKDSIVLVVCTFLICLLTLTRPYYGVLFLIPLWKAVKDKNKKMFFILPFLAIATICLFFINNHYFCSVYFNNIFTFEKMRSAGLGGMVLSLLNSIVEILRLIWYALRYKGSGVGWYYLLLGLELFGMAVICILRKIHKQAVSPLYIITLIGNSLILISIIEMYQLGVGARHILALLTVNAVVMILESHFSWGILLTAICLFSIWQTQGADGLPYAEESYSLYMDSLEEAFSEIIQISDDISYDNVVAMPTADSKAANPDENVSTYYGLLFAVPAGAGVSLDYQDFYDDPDNIKAKYILVHPEGSIRFTLENMGMTCVYQDSTAMLYSR